MRVLAHGVDLVEIQRIEAMLDEHGDRFLQRCFSEAERAYADSGRGRRAERYAARIACKEAVFKALGTGWSGGIRWLDVEVDREPSGRPRLALTGRCAELAAELGIVHWHVSLSHTTSNALASVVGCG